MALHTIVTMFPKPHFIHHAKPIHTKIAYKNYILEIASSKLAFLNSNPQNEGAKKLRTFLKERPHIHWSKN